MTIEQDPRKRLKGVLARGPSPVPHGVYMTGRTRSEHDKKEFLKKKAEESRKKFEK